MAFYDYAPDIVPMYFELGVIVISNIILGLILRIFLEKRKQITRILYFSFLGFLLPIFCSFAPKVIKVFYGGTLTLEQMLGSPGTLLNWFLLRLFEWRISLMFFLIGIYGFSIFGQITFSEGNNKKVYPKACLVFLAIGIIVVLFIYYPGDVVLQGIAFLYVAFYTIFVFFPILNRSLKIYLRRESLPIQKRTIAKQFIYIALMALFLILVITSFGFDGLYHLLTTLGYSIFYYLAWTFAILGFLTAYLGYILPYVKLNS